MDGLKECTTLNGITKSQKKACSYSYAKSNNTRTNENRCICEIEYNMKNKKG